MLTTVVNASNHTKCVSIKNQQYMTQPTLINLHPNEHNQSLGCYKFVVSLDRCLGICNKLNDLSNKLYVLNKAEDLNIIVFNIITGIDESKTLANNISCECKYKFDDRKCNLNQKWITTNINVNVKIWKKLKCAKMIIFGILLHGVVKMANIQKVLLMIQ